MFSFRAAFQKPYAGHSGNCLRFRAEFGLIRPFQNQVILELGDECRKDCCESFRKSLIPWTSVAYPSLGQKDSLLAHGRYGGGPAAKQVDRKAATNPELVETAPHTTPRRPARRSCRRAQAHPALEAARSRGLEA